MKILLLLVSLLLHINNIYVSDINLFGQGENSLQGKIKIFNDRLNALKAGSVKDTEGAAREAKRMLDYFKTNRDVRDMISHVTHVRHFLYDEGFYPKDFENLSEDVALRKLDGVLDSYQKELDKYAKVTPSAPTVTPSRFSIPPAAPTACPQEKLTTKYKIDVDKKSGFAQITADIFKKKLEEIIKCYSNDLKESISGKMTVESDFHTLLKYINDTIQFRDENKDKVDPTELANNVRDRVTTLVKVYNNLIGALTTEKELLPGVIGAKRGNRLFQNYDELLGKTVQPSVKTDLSGQIVLLRRKIAQNFKQLEDLLKDDRALKKFFTKIKRENIGRDKKGQVITKTSEEYAEDLHQKYIQLIEQLRKFISIWQKDAENKSMPQDIISERGNELNSIITTLLPVQPPVGGLEARYLKPDLLVNLRSPKFNIFAKYDEILKRPARPAVVTPPTTTARPARPSVVTPPTSVTPPTPSVPSTGVPVAPVAPEAPVAPMAPVAPAAPPV